MICAGYDFEESGAILYILGHGSYTVDCSLETYTTSVRYEPPCWFEAYNATVCGGETNGTALIGADCEIDCVGGEKTA